MSPTGRAAEPRRARAIVGAIVIAMLATACAPTPGSPSPGSPSPSSASPSATAAPDTSPTPAGSQDLAALYRSIQDDVVVIRELEPTTAVDPQVLDEAELQTRIEASFEEDNPEEELAATERLYKALGMIDEEADLADMYIELLGSQVAGFYDPDLNELFVISRSGAVGPAERVTFAHEFTHALQDQHFDLDSMGLDDVGEGDRAMARLSLIEGDATAVMQAWQTQRLTAEEQQEVFAAALDPEALAILRRMPTILRDSLTFPYTQGLFLILTLQAAGGWAAVDAAYDDPPASTEQLIHLEKYTAREAPIKVTLPDDLAPQMGPGWRVGLEDTLGEFQIAVWLREALRRVGPANDAAAGWGGDRVTVLHGPSDAWAVAIVTEWDSVEDATEFAEAAETASLAFSSGTIATQPGSTQVAILIGSSDQVAIQLNTILGLTGV